MPDPNLVISGLSQRTSVDGHELRIEIVRLEHETNWSLEIVDEDGNSTVWDDLFDTDPKQDERVIEAFKKTSRARWRPT